LTPIRVTGGFAEVNAALDRLLISRALAQLSAERESLAK
jgi:hypothetical protein